MLDTPDDINHFLILQRKGVPELQAICEGLGLPTEGSKDDLIDSLLRLSQGSQSDFTGPQAIPLRTKEGNKIIPGANEMMKKIRVMLFERGKNQSFHLKNGRGVGYKATLMGLKCEGELFKELLTSGLCIFQSHQKDLLGLLKAHYDRFNVHLINKPSVHGKSFLMLHVEAKKVA